MNRQVLVSLAFYRRTLKSRISASCLTVFIVSAAQSVIVSAQGAPATPARLEATKIVEGLRFFKAPMPAGELTSAQAATEEERWRSIERLRVLGPDGVEALARALADPDTRLRRNSLIALQALASGLSSPRRVARVDIRASAGALIAALTDPDSYVRAWAVSALGYLQPPPPDVVGALVSMLEDSDEGVRLSACGSLGQLGDRRASVLDALKRVRNDPHQDVRTCAQHLLTKLQP